MEPCEQGVGKSWISRNASDTKPAKLLAARLSEKASRERRRKNEVVLSI